MGRLRARHLLDSYKQPRVPHRPLQESQMLARQLRVFCSPEVALLNATVARDPSGGLEVYVAELDLSALEPGEDYVPIPGDPEGKEEYGIGASIVRKCL